MLLDDAAQGTPGSLVSDGARAQRKASPADGSVVAAVDALAVVRADAGQVVGAWPGVLQAAGLGEVRGEVQPLQEGSALQPRSMAWRHKQQGRALGKVEACQEQQVEPNQARG